MSAMIWTGYVVRILSVREPAPKVIAGEGKAIAKLEAEIPLDAVLLATEDLFHEHKTNEVFWRRRVDSHGYINYFLLRGP